MLCVAVSHVPRWLLMGLLLLILIKLFVKCVLRSIKIATLILVSSPLLRYIFHVVLQYNRPSLHMQSRRPK
jgi:hypothetical protein